MPSKYTPEQRIAKFWEKVDKSGGGDACWIWTGRRNQKGYGAVHWGKSVQQAHRIAYWLNTEEWAGGLMVLHHCDNPSCVNPKHLYLGTVDDNARDCVARGRQAKGEGNGQHKLTAKQVKEIRALAAHGVMQKDLANQYNVARPVISYIVRRITWNWLE